MAKKILKKTYLPNSKAFKVEYDGGGIGYGADSSKEKQKPTKQSTPMSTYIDKVKEEDRLPTSSVHSPVGDNYRKAGKDTKVDPPDDKFTNQQLDAYRAAGIELDEDDIPTLTDKQERLLNKGMMLLDKGINPNDLGEEFKPILKAMTDVYENYDDDKDDVSEKEL